MEIRWRNKNIVRNWIIYPVVLCAAIILISCYTLHIKEDAYTDYKLVGCYKQMEGSEKRGFVEKHYCDFQKLDTGSMFTETYKPYAYSDMTKYKDGVVFRLVDHEQNKFWLIFNGILICLWLWLVISFMIGSAIEQKFPWEDYTNKSL